ncbi:MAG: cache domain-containing protein [bacterium]|nr:cache domain-containing protein [bacterium]
MLSIFWINNIHFAIEFFGAVMFIVAAWLIADAGKLTRTKKSLVKVFGFGAVAVWQVLHALDISNELLLLGGMTLLILGLLCIALSVILETPPLRPKTFELLFFIPSVAGLLSGVYVAGGLLSLAIAVLAFRRYKAELNKPLKPFWFCFAFLAASFFLGSVSVKSLSPGTLWFAEHALRALAFGILAVWVWQYLLPRLKEELLLIFVAMSLAVSLVVTFTFSALLLARMRADASQSIQANARVFSYTLSRMSSELRAKSINGAGDEKLSRALATKDFAAMEDQAKMLQERLMVDFLTLTNETGEVLVRANLRTARGETILGDSAGVMALSGISAGDIGTTLPEGLSVRGASPVKDTSGKILGIIEVGESLDNVFLDAFKKVTGLDATVFQNDTLYASTVLDIDGLTRPTGVKLTDAAVRQSVLENGQAYSGGAFFLGRPHLASYIPLKDSKGTTLGIIATSRPEVEISKAAIATNRLTLFTTLLIVLALLIPAYFIVRKISDEQ